LGFVDSVTAICRLATNNPRSRFEHSTQSASDEGAVIDN
jgi:hypothetical protein